MGAVPYDFTSIVYIILSKLLDFLAFPFGEGVNEVDGRGQNESGLNARNDFNVQDLSRLLLAPLSKSTLPTGESKGKKFY